MARPTLRHATLGLLLGVSLLLAGCGAGSFVSTTSSKPTAYLQIQTTRLPAAQRDADYEPTQLSAAGAAAPVSWSVLDGRLPAGMRMTSGGMLEGRPAEEGLFPFTVQASDGVETDAADLALAVDTFALQVEGLFLGDAWAGRPVRLVALGPTGQVRFEASVHGSGGAFDLVDEARGEAVWIPGPSSERSEDVVVATDVTTGKTTTVALPVVPNPAADLRAAHGASDVWYVDFGRKLGNHGYATDWDATLHAVGLRSTSRAPTQADQLAERYTRIAVLHALARYFGNGLAISFPFDRPGAGHTAPAAGSWLAPTPDRYNVIAVLCGRAAGVVGMGFVDGATNDLLENDSTTPSIGDLGVFSNQVALFFNAGWQNEALPSDPVNAGDVPTLEAMLYGGATEGERATRIRRIADGFAGSLAAVIAHEIGHALGLGHSDTVDGSIMNSGVTFDPWESYRFLDAQRARLQGALPGPGRVAGTSGAAPSVPQGGLAACRLRAASSSLAVAAADAAGTRDGQ